MDTSILTDENIDDMIETAQYGGISYWAGEAEPDVRAAEFLANPRVVMVFRDSEGGGDVIGLTYADLRKAYFDLLSLDQRFVNKTIHGYFIDSWRERDEDGIEMGNIDADAADVWVQVAAFGEVVYG